MVTNIRMTNAVRYKLNLICTKLGRTQAEVIEMLADEYIAGSKALAMMVAEMPAPYGQEAPKKDEDESEDEGESGVIVSGVAGESSENLTA